MNNEVLYQITAPHLCAGITFLRGRCIGSAPILRWAIGKKLSYVKSYCKRKDWKMEVVHVVD